MDVAATGEPERSWTVMDQPLRSLRGRSRSLPRELSHPCELLGSDCTDLRERRREWEPGRFASGSKGGERERETHKEGEGLAETHKEGEGLAGRREGVSESEGRRGRTCALWAKMSGSRLDEIRRRSSDRHECLEEAFVKFPRTRYERLRSRELRSNGAAICAITELRFAYANRSITHRPLKQTKRKFSREGERSSCHC